MARFGLSWMRLSHTNFAFGSMKRRMSQAEQTRSIHICRHEGENSVPGNRWCDQTTQRARLVGPSNRTQKREYARCRRPFGSQEPAPRISVEKRPIAVAHRRRLAAI